MHKTKTPSRSLVKKCRGRDLYHHTMNEFPSFMKHLVNDLQQIDGYTENEIAFGSGISLDAVRKLTHGKTDKLDRKVFHEMLHFYARAVCGWCAGDYKPRDFELFLD